MTVPCRDPVRTPCKVSCPNQTPELGAWHFPMWDREPGEDGEGTPTATRRAGLQAEARQQGQAGGCAGEDGEPGGGWELSQRAEQLWAVAAAEGSSAGRHPPPGNWEGTPGHGASPSTGTPPIQIPVLWDLRQGHLSELPYGPPKWGTLGRRPERIGIKPRA